MSAMVALEILLNGRRVCIAGAEDLAVLTASLSVSGTLGPKTVEPEPVGTVDDDDRRSPPHVHVGGLTCRGPGLDDVHLRWATDLSIKPGDTFSVRLVEVEPTDADPPARETDAEEPTFDSNERRMYEVARDTYFALRAKYGGGDV